MKGVSPAVAYLAMIPALTKAAREVGYALAVHGSMGRDLDLIAVPWIEDAASAEGLIMRLLAEVGWNRGHLTHRAEQADKSQSNGDIAAIKPHGRLAWSIHFENGMFLDVSVTPRSAPEKPKASAPAPLLEGAEPEGAGAAHKGGDHGK